MTKKRLSEQFREQLDSLGKTLARHTRSLAEHFETQEAFLAARQEELEKDDQKLLPGTSEISNRIEEVLSPYLEGNFNLLTVTELKSLCSKHGIKRYSGLRKKQLIDILDTNGINPPPLPLTKLVKKLKKSELERIVQVIFESCSLP